MKTCRAPVEQPSKPRWTPPPMACDTHCHVFGPADRFPYSPDRTYTPPDAGFERLSALHRHLGLARAVLVQASCHGSDNSGMLDAIARSRGAYRGVAMVGPGVTDEQLRALHAGGVRGIRFNFVHHLGGAPDMGFFHEALARIAPLGWHVVLHFDAEDIPEHRALLDALPVPFIIDHMGRVKAGEGLAQPAFVQLLDLMRRNPKAWVKVSGPERISTAGAPFEDAMPYARALAEAAPDRVLWGTDFPHPNITRDMPDDGWLVDLFAKTFPDPAMQQRILVDNPTRLYWAN